MLKLDLAALERAGSLRVQTAIPEGDALWAETDLRFLAPLAVDLQAEVVAGGQYLVRGTLRSEVAQDCRRCLKPVRVPVSQQVTFVFSPRDETEGEEDGDPEIRTIESDAQELDLGQAIREELVLTVPAYAVCSPDCKGLCPSCGVDLNVETCQCVRHEADPRWDALRALKTD